MERLTIIINITTLDKLHKICKVMDKTPSGTIRKLIQEYEL